MIMITQERRVRRERGEMLHQLTTEEVGFTLVRFKCTSLIVRFAK